MHQMQSKWGLDNQRSIVYFLITKKITLKTMTSLDACQA